jgi:hypothetical protein
MFVQGGAMGPKASRRYDRGVKDDETTQVHAAELGDVGQYNAICGAGTVVPLPGYFDPTNPSSCRDCRSLV